MVKGEISVREMIKRCIERLDGKASKQQIIDWINENYTNVNQSTIELHLYSLSVNVSGRINHARNQRERPLNADYDFLYKKGNEYEIYDRDKHGNYGLMESNGKVVVTKDGIPLSNYTDSPLLKFLKDDMIMHANYQPIVIKILLEKGNELEYTATVKEISDKIKLLNFDRDYSPNDAINAVKDALKKFVTFDNEKASLHLDQFSSNDIPECLRVCGQKIAHWHINEITKKKFDVWHILPGSRDEKFPYLDEFIETNSIGIGWAKVGDVSNLTEEQIKEEFVNQYEEGKGSFLDFTKIQQKDLIVLSRGLEEIIDFGIVVSDYYHKDVVKPSYPHRKDLVWLKQGPIRAEDLPNPTLAGFIATCGKIIQRREEMINVLLGKNTMTNTKYFLVQVTEFGSKNIINNGFYSHTDWQETPRDEDHGKVKVGDLLLVYFGYKAIDFQKTLKMIYEVDSISENNVKFQLKPWKTLKGLLREDVQQAVDSGKLSENFNRLSQQGFNITEIPKSDIDYILGSVVSGSGMDTDVTSQYKEFFDILERKNQFIFYGPPGTGKTWTAKQIAEEYVKNSDVHNFSDDQYYKYIIEVIKNAALLNGYALFEHSVNHYTLKNSNKEIRLFVAFSQQGKTEPHKCSVFVPAATAKFLAGESEEEHYIIIVNSDTKNFVVFPHQFVIENFRLASGDNWDVTGKKDHTFNVEIYSDKAQVGGIRNASNYLHNVDILFDKDAIPCRYVEKITFHQSYSYEEFIEGIRPKTSDNKKYVTYPIQAGIFKKLCHCAKLDGAQRYLLLIDEINRGNMSKIFGELITLIEKDKRNDEVKLPYSKERFSIPENIFIIGTMNTADRSLVHIDAALRRRFAFCELMPDISLLGKTIGKIHLGKLLEEINKRIRTAGMRDKQIGHSYFMSEEEPISGIEDLQFAFANEILPLLREYFYDDEDGLRIILGNQFLDDEGNVIPEWKTSLDSFEEAIKTAYPNAIEQ